MQEVKYVRVTCPRCGAQYKIKASAIPPEGRTGRCKHCQTKITVRLKNKSESTVPLIQKPATHVMKYCQSCKRLQEYGNKCYVCGGVLQLRSGEKDQAISVNSKNNQKKPVDSPNTGVQIKAQFFPLMWLLFFTRPTFEIDGEKHQGKWNQSQFFNLSPGKHRIKIYFYYIFLSEAGANALDIELRSGETYDIQYNFNIPFIFAKGEIKINDVIQSSQNQASQGSQPVAVSLPWYRSKAAIIWITILFWPLGLILLWQSDLFTQKTKIIVTVVLFLFLWGYFNSLP